MPISGLENDYPWRVDNAGDYAPWVVPGWWIAASDPNAIVAGRLNYTPIFVSENRTYDRIGIKVTADAGTLARLGIYEWSNGSPGDLILDAGTVATDAIAEVEIIINQTLERGYYFLAIVGDGTPTLAAPNLAYCKPPIPGQCGTCSMTPMRIILYLNDRDADVAGGLADPAPAPASSEQPDYGCHVMLRGT